MASATSDRQAIRQLFDLRNRFTAKSADEKLALLRALKGIRSRTGIATVQLHTALCFIRAFPDTKEHCRCANLQLESFHERIAALPRSVRHSLQDSGIAGTPIHYRFSFEVATWLSQRAHGTASIDCDEIDDESRLDELLSQLLHPAEEDYFNSGSISTCDWISLCASAKDGTDFDWLIAQLHDSRRTDIWSQLYNAADLALTWNLGDSVFSKTRNVLRIPGIKLRRNGMRRKVRAVKNEIMRPLRSLHQVSPARGKALVDIAIASLAVRHRETNHFNFANPHEVYVADVGKGVLIAAFGLLEQHRYALECTMGFLILSNGVPVGYGGGSGVFRQVNTGLNIFDEYRGSEASFLWVQVMRVYRQLFDCTRFIVNPYQFGSENTEALKSGAFWFHYRLGYRPVEPEIRTLAKAEAARSRAKPNYRSDLSTLRRLASCDLHLTLPGCRAGDLFDEQWLETSSKLATQIIAAGQERTRASAIRHLSASVARDLRINSVSNWTPAEQRGLAKLAPFIASVEPAGWATQEKQRMRKVVRAKGGPCEAKFARLLAGHDVFRSSLVRRCRDSARS
jgi:hypothetical protein